MPALVPILGGLAGRLGGQIIRGAGAAAGRIFRGGRGGGGGRMLPPGNIPPMIGGGAAGRGGAILRGAGKAAGAAATGSILYQAARGGGRGLPDGILPPVVDAETVERISCPPGYVAVDTDGDGVNDACMLKEYARKFGLYKSRPKPPVSGWDARAIKRAASAKKRVKKLAGSVGFTTTEKGRGRRSTAKACGCRGKCKC